MFFFIWLCVIPNQLFYFHSSFKFIIFSSFFNILFSKNVFLYLDMLLTFKTFFRAIQLSNLNQEDRIFMHERKGNCYHEVVLRENGYSSFGNKQHTRVQKDLYMIERAHPRFLQGRTNFQTYIILQRSTLFTRNVTEYLQGIFFRNLKQSRFRSLFLILKDFIFKTFLRTFYNIFMSSFSKQKKKEL